ncbi:efflux RND transporter periplasmic adaptor subunit [Sediminimonas qiaohouensis]|uniref:efflux RND transporter periplasmic adaptor subunit n=1 Tax=Sediminimonas qiaohouensis TaxID=552061 RepID=UPI0004051E8F|nr:efflux RND transporter periplasmic adaptor subunit [Sediminimonas qiaohouensis]
MRLIPILTAIVVSAVLYLLVMERDLLFQVAQEGVAPLQERVEELTGDAQPPTGADTADTAAPADTQTAQTAAQQPPAQENAQQVVSVVAQRSTARTVDSAVILRGETQAYRQVEARAETSGQVISQPLRKGAEISKDEILCKIDAGTRQAALKEAESRLAEARARVPEAQSRVEEAKARLEEARINDNAASKLSVEGFASGTRVATAHANLRSAEAAVQTAKAGLQGAQSAIQSAEAAVAAARKEIERLTISAPFAGLLESDTAEVGSLLQPGGLCATVIQLDPIKLVGFVPETEVGRINIGAPARARLASGDQVQGRVTFLSRSADPTTRTFRVEIEVANPDGAVRDGQTAEIGIAADGARAHLLPASALTLDDDGTLGVRIVGDGDVAAFRPVTLLRDTAEGVLVTGLSDQVDVIVVGQEFVTAGVPLDPTFNEAKP